ncbi:MAG: hypothetical protein AB2693_29450, partial [Candidatus Thiodiazotropha sp.]
MINSYQPSLQKIPVSFLTLGQGSILTPQRLQSIQMAFGKLLKNLKPHKATGPDDISPRFLKEMAEPLT